MDIVIVEKSLEVLFYMLLGFGIGHFYSKERFEKAYREGFEKGYFLGKMDKGDK